MSLKAFFLKEHISRDSVDTQLFILYDPSVETYFYYGTRNHNGSNDYVNYEGEFHYSRFTTLINMVEYIFDRFSSEVTHEFHSIPIEYDEYDSLNFFKLSKKISKKTEIAAYDKLPMTKDRMIELLDMLVPHEIYVE